MHDPMLARGLRITTAGCFDMYSGYRGDELCAGAPRFVRAFEQ